MLPRPSALLSLLGTMFRRQDPMAKDIGHAGELLTARLRVLLILVLAINPTKNLILSPTDGVAVAGFGVTVAAVLITVLIWKAAGRPQPPRFLPWLTSQLDVAMVTLGSLSFVFAGEPIVATNSFVHWSYYMLAIGATCLRHNAWLVMGATAASIAGQFAVAAFVDLQWPNLQSAQYGYFSWDTQVGRGIALVVMGLLAVSIVTRNRQVWETSVRDRLTGLHNRRFFDGVLEFMSVERARDRRPFCLALIDVDHFKKINDTKGHDAGDLALVKLGAFLKEHFRSSDIPARWGGEEFAVVLPESSVEDAARRLETFRSQLAEAPLVIPITVSIGLASFPADGESPDTLVVAADQRLLRAKRDGRNRLVTSA